MTEKSAAELEREAEARRAELADTADTLRDKMSPGQMMDEVFSYFRDSGGSTMASNFGRQVRDNPLPLALIGAGIAWLMAGGGPSSDRIRYTARDYYDEWGDDWDDDWPDRRYPPPAPTGLERPATATTPGYVPAGTTSTTTGTSSGSSMTDRARSAASSAAGSARDSAASATDRARGAAASASDSARSATSSVGQSASSAASGVSSAAGGAASAVGDTAAAARERAAAAGRSVYRGSAYAGRRAQQTFTSVLHEEPLVIGAIGIAVGAAIGAMLPRTELEDEYVGPYRDRLRDDASERARQGMEDAKEVAAATYQSAKEEADRKGLTGGDEPVAKKVSDVAGTAAQTAKEKSQDKASRS